MLFLHFLQLLVNLYVMNEKIILLGYMGSGKSTIGRLLAHSLSLAFEDLDHFIARQEGKSIPEIFSQKGEIYFRKQEQTYLKELLASPSAMVIALGGGTPCYGEAMELVRAASPYSFYLQLPTADLLLRLLPQKQQRPLIAHLSEKDMEEFLNKHLFERFPFYTQAHFILPCHGLSPEQIVEKIKEKIK